MAHLRSGVASAVVGQSAQRNVELACSVAGVRDLDPLFHVFLRRLRAFRRCAVVQPETFATLCASMCKYCEQPELQQKGPAGLLVHMC
eukprot:230017-Alexandrium_andersonii.AAC.1